MIMALRKTFIVTSTIAIILISNSCKVKTDNKTFVTNLNNSVNNSVSQVNSRDNFQGSDYYETISEGRNYKITGNDTVRKYKYYIYDLEHKIVQQAEVEQMPPSITYIYDNALEIRFFVGTNTILCQYYDVEKNKFSQEYWNPKLIKGRLIVYMLGEDTSRKLIVQDIFNPELFYREYKRDFSPVVFPDTDLESAKFIDKDHLQITYFATDEFLKKDEIIDLTKK